MPPLEFALNRRSLLWAGVAGLGAGIAPSALFAESAPKVRAPCGTYIGQTVHAPHTPQRSRTTLAQFLGIRYGIDTRRTRFQKPIAAPPLVRPQQADHFGAA
jgi:hypothetical protein